MALYSQFFRIIVSKSSYKDMKHLLHVGHLGIENKEKAYDTVCWPGINGDLENIVNSCDTCHKDQSQQKDESLITNYIPTGPWAKVGTEFFELKVKSYFLVVDYTTNFFDISLLPKKLSTVVTHAKRMFSKFEILKKLCQIMDLIILERITNCLQNNGTLNMTYLALITQNLMDKSNKLSRQ